MLNSNSAYDAWDSISGAFEQPISDAVAEVKKTGVYKSPIEAYIQSTAPKPIKDFLQKWIVNNSVNSFFIYAVATFATVYCIKYFRSM